jgi:DNA transformation protein and related proteins
MARPDEYVTHLIDLLRPLGPVQTARFFGGTSLKLHGRQFAMLMAARLYFVVDDRTRPRYEQAGSGCFSYLTKKGLVDVRKYYEVPGEVQDDARMLVAWAREAASAG